MKAEVRDKLKQFKLDEEQSNQREFNQLKEEQDKLKMKLQYTIQQYNQKAESMNIKKIIEQDYLVRENGSHKYMPTRSQITSMVFDK